MDADTMRRAGYRVVDLLVEYLDDPARPPLRRATPDEMSERLSAPAPDGPEELEGLLETLRRDVLPFSSRGDHPGLLAFVPFAGTWPGALGDLIAAAANLYAGSWMESAGPSRLELEVLGCFADWVGDRFYVVASGEVEARYDGAVVSTLGRGEGFGEIALLRDVPRTVTVVSRSDVSLYALERDDFLDALTGSARARHEAERLADARLAVAPGTDVGARIGA